VEICCHLVTIMNVLAYAAFGLFLVLSLSVSRGDEPSPVLSPDQTIFKSVNAFGGVSLTEPIGTFVTTDGMSIPLTISFDSTSTLVSPFLGLGWSIPLLESRATLESPSVLGFLLPGGIQLYLAQAKDQSFNSFDGMWTATVANDDIKLVAPGGWILSYHQGHLVKIDMQNNNVITIDHDDDGATAYFNGSIIITASNKGQIRIADKELDVTLANRPVVQQMNGTVVVSRLEPSLVSIEGDSLPKHTWNYSLDSSRNEVLSDSQNGNYTWNPTSGIILTDKDWNYSVDSTYKLLDPVVSIERHDAAGKKESYVRDDLKGFMTKSFADGTVRKTLFFTSSGAFYGLPRSIEVDKGNTRILLTKLDYDPTGNLIRKLDLPGSENDYGYDANNRLTSFKKDSKLICKREYDAQGKLISSAFPDKHQIYRMQYLPDDEIYLTLTDLVTGKTLVATKTTKKFIDSSLNVREYGFGSHS
jgi:YD repeat-containing protein